MDKHSRMYMDTEDYFIKQISHFSKGVCIVVSALCQLTMCWAICVLIFDTCSAYLRIEKTVFLRYACRALANPLI